MSRLSDLVRRLRDPSEYNAADCKEAALLLEEQGNELFMHEVSFMERLDRDIRDTIYKFYEREIGYEPQVIVHATDDDPSYRKMVAKTSRFSITLDIKVDKEDSNE